MRNKSSTTYKHFHPFLKENENYILELYYILINFEYFKKVRFS